MPSSTQPTSCPSADCTSSLGAAGERGAAPGPAVRVVTCRDEPAGEELHGAEAFVLPTQHIAIESV